MSPQDDELAPSLLSPETTSGLPPHVCRLKIKVMGRETIELDLPGVPSSAAAPDPGPGAAPGPPRIDTSLTVGELKSMLCQRTDVPVDRQRLIWQGRVLREDDALLSGYGIRDGHALHLVPRPAAIAPSAPDPAPAAAAAAPRRPAPSSAAAAAAPVLRPVPGTGGQMMVGAFHGPAGGPGGAADLNTIMASMFGQLMDAPALTNLAAQQDAAAHARLQAAAAAAQAAAAAAVPQQMGVEAEMRTRLRDLEQRVENYQNRVTSEGPAPAPAPGRGRAARSGEPAAAAAAAAAATAPVPGPGPARARATGSDAPAPNRARGPPRAAAAPSRPRTASGDSSASSMPGLQALDDDSDDSYDDDADADAPPLFDPSMLPGLDDGSGTEDDVLDEAAYLARLRPESEDSADAPVLPPASPAPVPPAAASPRRRAARTARPITVAVPAAAAPRAPPPAEAAAAAAAAARPAAAALPGPAPALSHDQLTMLSLASLAEEMRRISPPLVQLSALDQRPGADVPALSAPLRAYLLSMLPALGSAVNAAQALLAYEAPSPPAPQGGGWATPRQGWATPPQAAAPLSPPTPTPPPPPPTPAYAVHPHPQGGYHHQPPAYGHASPVPAAGRFVSWWGGETPYGAGYHHAPVSPPSYHAPVPQYHHHLGAAAAAARDPPPAFPSPPPSAEAAQMAELAMARAVLEMNRQAAAHHHHAHAQAQAQLRRAEWRAGQEAAPEPGWAAAAAPGEMRRIDELMAAELLGPGGEFPGEPVMPSPQELRRRDLATLRARAAERAGRVAPRREQQQ